MGRDINIHPSDLERLATLLPPLNLRDADKSQGTLSWPHGSILPQNFPQHSDGVKWSRVPGAIEVCPDTQLLNGTNSEPLRGQTASRIFGCGGGRCLHHDLCPPPLSRMDTMHPSRGQVQSAQSTIAPVMGSPLPVLTENFTIGLGRVNTIGAFANSIGCTSGSSEVLGWKELSIVAFLAGAVHSLRMISPLNFQLPSSAALSSLSSWPLVPSCEGTKAEEAKSYRQRIQRLPGALPV